MGKKKQKSFKDIMINYGVIIIMIHSCYLHRIHNTRTSLPVNNLNNILMQHEFPYL